MRLQFRLRPLESLEDAEPGPIEEALAALPGVDRVRIYDDRASDATFVTAVVEVADSPGAETLEELRSALLALPRLRVTVGDYHRKEIPVAEISAEEIPAHARRD